MDSKFLARLVVAGLAALSAAGLAAQTMARIAPFDAVKVTVVGTEIPAASYVVDAEGAIEYPFVGRVMAKGLTVRELADELRTRLLAAEVLVGTPQVTVDLQQTPNKTVTVSGAVNNKGEIKYGGELSVFSALVRAGGAASDAGDEILLIRAPKPGSQTDDDYVRLSRRRIESGEFDATATVQDGDRLVVTKARQVYIDGQVGRPGGYTVEVGATLRQALALAGGVSDLGALNRIRVLRNGKPLSKVDLDATVIEPGDTITVPRRFM